MHISKIYVPSRQCSLYEMGFNWEFKLNLSSIIIRPRFLFNTGLIPYSTKVEQIMLYKHSFWQ